MMDLRARVSYLQGLANGLNIPEDSREGQLLQGIVDVLTDFAEEVRELQDSHEQMEEYIEALDEDLYQLEGDFYDETYYLDDDFEEDDDYEKNEKYDEYVEVNCPRCGETVMFKSDILDDAELIEVTCPNCDEVVFVNDYSYISADEPEELISKPSVKEDL
ncbi:MAG: AraC family transcriptional regulator [Desulfotomaculum sp.]|nr:AraC family transcriptional regulator [Desulfotomaculum sp.]